MRSRGLRLLTAPDSLEAGAHPARSGSRGPVDRILAKGGGDSAETTDAGSFAAGRRRCERRGGAGWIGRDSVRAGPVHGGAVDVKEALRIGEKGLDLGSPQFKEELCWIWRRARGDRGMLLFRERVRALRERM